MSRSAISIYVLFALLVGTNAMWLFRETLGTSGSSEPIEMECTLTEESARFFDSIVLPLSDAVVAAAAPNATKDTVIRAAQSAARGTNLICMSDPAVVQVRGVGLRFNADGRLTGATVMHCPP